MRIWNFPGPIFHTMRGPPVLSSHVLFVPNLPTVLCIVSQEVIKGGFFPSISPCLNLYDTHTYLPRPFLLCIWLSWMTLGRQLFLEIHGSKMVAAFGLVAVAYLATSNWGKNGEQIFPWAIRDRRRKTLENWCAMLCSELQVQKIVPRGLCTTMLFGLSWMKS